MKTPVREQVNAMDAGTYFKLLASLMKDNPPTVDDAPTMANLKKIGIVPGQDFDMSRLDPAVARALRAPQAAIESIMSRMKNAGLT
jgi:DNA sulfur modification protein DndE